MNYMKSLSTPRCSCKIHLPSDYILFRKRVQEREGKARRENKYPSEQAPFTQMQVLQEGPYCPALQSQVFEALQFTGANVQKKEKNRLVNIVNQREYMINKINIPLQKGYGFPFKHMQVPVDEPQVPLLLHNTGMFVDGHVASIPSHILIIIKVESRKVEEEEEEEEEKKEKQKEHKGFRIRYGSV